MTLLGIETATTVCAAAVVRDGTVLAEELVDERNVHAERLMSMIDAVFRQSGTRLEKMDGIAVSIGPGSFTGLRIGLSVAKGLAYASGKPILPVPTLEGLAEKAAHAGGKESRDRLILPVLDARRGDVYCALYKRTGGNLQQVWEQQIMPLEAVAAAVQEWQVLVTGDAREALGQMVRARFPESAGRVEIMTGEGARCSAVEVARIGTQMLTAGKMADPGLLEPHYLRDFLTTTSH
jgi:tRNA threonylcarbamoyladenosine biosynthesis protein TsaB